MENLGGLPNSDESKEFLDHNEASVKKWVDEMAQINALSKLGGNSSFFQDWHYAEGNIARAMPERQEQQINRCDNSNETLMFKSMEVLWGISSPRGGLLWCKN